MELCAPCTIISILAWMHHRRILLDRALLFLFNSCGKHTHRIRELTGTKIINICETMSYSCYSVRRPDPSLKIGATGMLLLAVAAGDVAVDLAGSLSLATFCDGCFP